MEESGIAKGIRRMIAVTGTEAREAISTAAAFESRFASVQNMTGKERDEGFKTLTLVRWLSKLGCNKCTDGFVFLGPEPG
jgi:alanyl-tRNA synthetase